MVVVEYHIAYCSLTKKVVNMIETKRIIRENIIIDHHHIFSEIILLLGSNNNIIYYLSIVKPLKDVLYSSK